MTARAITWADWQAAVDVVRAGLVARVLELRAALGEATDPETGFLHPAGEWPLRDCLLRLEDAAIEADLETFEKQADYFGWKLDLERQWYEKATGRPWVAPLPGSPEGAGATP
jgi:hypothetical protein